MFSMFENTIVSIGTLPNSTLYLFFLFTTFIEYMVPPYPGDTIVVFGAYLAGIGKLNPFTLYGITTFGNTCGFLFLFSISKYYGRNFLLKKNYRFFPQEVIFKTEKWFHRYGVGVIIMNRFLSGARSAVPLIAGISNMRTSTITLAALLSGMMWNALLISSGYLVGKNWQVVVTAVKRYNQFIFIIFIGLLGFYLWKRKKAKANNGKT